MAPVSESQQILAVIAGLAVGFALGVIGGGGSILAVPLLLYFVGIRDPHEVIGTTALAVSANAYINLIPHWRSGNVRWRAAVGFAIPGAVGAWAGSTVGKLVHGADLLFLFAVLMLVVGALMLRERSARETGQDHWRRHMLVRVIPAGLVVGLVSGFFGIGGGFLIVPGLIFSTGLPMINAIGSSLFSVGTFGLTTAVNYALSGLVNWLVVLDYVIGGTLGGILGARLANRLAHRKRALNMVFSGVVFVVALYMIASNLGPLLHGFGR